MKKYILKAVNVEILPEVVVLAENKKEAEKIYRHKVKTGMIGIHVSEITFYTREAQNESTMSEL